MAREKPYVDVTISEIKVERWKVFCEIAKWAMNVEPDDKKDMTEIGLDLLDLFIRHVSDAKDTPALTILINAVAQPVDGFHTLIIRDIPDEAVKYITARTRQVGMPRMEDVVNNMVAAAMEKSLTVSKVTPKKKEGANVNGTTEPVAAAAGGPAAGGPAEGTDSGGAPKV